MKHSLILFITLLFLNNCGDSKDALNNTATQAPATAVPVTANTVPLSTPTAPDGQPQTTEIAPISFDSIVAANIYNKPCVNFPVRDHTGQKFTVVPLSGQEFDADGNPISRDFPSELKLNASMLELLPLEAAKDNHVLAKKSLEALSAFLNRFKTDGSYDMNLIQPLDPDSLANLKAIDELFHKVQALLPVLEDRIRELSTV